MARQYGALVAASTRDLEDVDAAREALIEIDVRWANDQIAWRLSKGLADYAFARKCGAEADDHNEVARSVVAYYTAIRLQEELRRLRLRQTASAA